MLQSAHRWLDLEDAEYLYLEGAEDLDAYARGSVKVEQIKASIRPITLNSDSVREAIASYWRLRNHNPNRVIYFRLLSRAPAAVERGHPFGVNIKGIDLWRQAALDRRKADQLLPFLLRSGSLPSDLRNLLESQDKDQVLSELVHRIAWDTDGPAPQYIEEAIRRKLVMHGDKFAVPPADAAAVVSRILEEVWSVACRKQDRWLDKVRFLDLFAEATLVSLPRTQIHSAIRVLGQLQAGSAGLLMGSGSQTFGLRQIARRGAPPLAKDVEPREKLVASLASILEEEGLLCISGSVGMGKTTLARLLVGDDSTAWLWSSLKGHEVNAVANELSALDEEIAAGRWVRDLVLDDFDPFQAGAKSLEPAVGAMLYSLLQRGGRVIITSHSGLPARVLRALGLPVRCNQRAACLGREDIARLASRLGCPDARAKEWSGVVELHTQGHPQLVHARLYHLRSKGWPSPESSDLFRPGPAIEQERREIRQSLLHDLESEERELIYRLSLGGTVFRRDHAVAIGALAKSIARPGEVVDRLAGPWIEELGGGYFRLSALLGETGINEWSPERVRELRAGIAACILECRPVTIQDAGTAMMLALAGRAPRQVVRVIMSVLAAPESSRDAIYKNLWWVGSLSVDATRPIFPEDPVANFMLRSLQFKVVAHEDPTRAPVVVSCWEQEIDTNQEQAAVTIQRHLIASTALLSTTVPLAARDSVRYLVQFAEDYDQEAVLKERLGDAGPPPGHAWLTGRFDPLIDLLPCVLIRCTSPQYLQELLECLGEMSDERRARILTGLDLLEGNANIVIDTVWLTEARSPSPDWQRCLSVFKTALKCATEWRCLPLASAAARAAAIILDEYLRDPAGGLRVLEEARGLLGKTSPLLDDAQATVLLHQKRYAEALALWQGILPGWRFPGWHGNVLPAFAHRKAGIAAHNLTEWDVAAYNYLEAAQLSGDLGAPWLRIGFLVDAGYALSKAGMYERAVNLFTESLEGFENEPMRDTDGRRVVLRRRLGHTLVAVVSQFRPGVGESRFPVPPAFCSDPEADPRLLEGARLPIEFCWMHVAQIEYYATGSQTAFQRTVSRVEKSQFVAAQYFVGELSVLYALRSGAISDLPMKALGLARLWEGFSAHRASGRGVVDPRSSGEEVVAAPAQNRSLVISTLFSGLVIQAGSGGIRRETVDSWRSSLRSSVGEGAVSDWLELAEAILFGEIRNAEVLMKQGEADPQQRALAALKVCLERSSGPEDSFYAGTLLLENLGKYPWSDEAGESLGSLVADQWRLHAQVPATLRSPRLTVPAILDGCACKKAGIARAATILLAAEDAVRVRLPSKVREQLRELSTRPGSP